MQPMTLAQAQKHYYNILLDMAKNYSKYIITMTEFALQVGTWDNDMLALVNEWAVQRQTIIEELAGIHN